LDNPEAFVDW